MRFVELICFSVILALFSSLCSGFIFQIRRLDHQLEKIQLETDSLVFISQSFCNACKGKGFSSLDEWKLACRDMWQLEKIEWTSCGQKESGLIHASWSGPYGSGEVYAKK